MGSIVRFCTEGDNKIPGSWQRNPDSLLIKNILIEKDSNFKLNPKKLHFLLTANLEKISYMGKNNSTNDENLIFDLLLQRCWENLRDISIFRAQGPALNISPLIIVKCPNLLKVYVHLDNPPGTKLTKLNRALQTVSKRLIEFSLSEFSRLDRSNTHFEGDRYFDYSIGDIPHLHLMTRLHPFSLISILKRSTSQGKTKRLVLNIDYDPTEEIYTLIRRYVFAMTLKSEIGILELIESFDSQKIPPFLSTCATKTFVTVSCIR